MKPVLTIAAFFLLVYGAYRTYRFATSEPGLAEKIAAGAVILDVRTPAEYQRGHINGALNIPLSALRRSYRELDPAKNYITCCSHGLRSVKAQSLLQERGFSHVYNGGAWIDLQNATRSTNKPLK